MRVFTKSRTCAAVITPSTPGRKRHTDIYPVKLCRRAVQQILKMERWNLVMQHVLRQATSTQALTAEAENSSERDEAILSALPASERRKLELSMRKLHRACANVAMESFQGERAGCRQITPLQCLRRGHTPRAKPVSASHENREPWRVVGL